MASSDVDHVLEKLAKDVENAVHALYRGEVRQQTARTRTGTFVREAHAAIIGALVLSIVSTLLGFVNFGRKLAGLR